MNLVKVMFPAPWWTPLTYSCERELPEWLRVSAPLGKDRRIALTVGGEAEDIASERLKELCAVIDEEPALPEELLRLIKWFGETWLIGLGLSMKTVLPRKFFSEEQLPPLPKRKSPAKKFSSDYFYSTDTKKRLERITESVEKDSRALVLFFETKSASSYWRSLPAALRGEGALWPSTPAAQWKLWKRARLGDVRFIVGSPAAAFAPLAGLSAIIMDEENQGAWRSQGHPHFNMRSVMGKRAEIAGAEFILCGSMPSAKSFLRADPKCSEERNDSRLVFVGTKEALSPDFEALRDKLPVSLPLIRETAKARRGGRWAFWLLDRKGYAGEISCEECGSTVRCPKCGAAMRWEELEKRLHCLACGCKSEIPESCPNCGGLLLSGVHPGVEALYKRAEGALKYRFKNVLLLQNGDQKEFKPERLIKDYPNGALIIGTRRLLSLCDELSPGAIGWIDADAEARSPEYDARSRAFSMVWESMWRGNSQERKVIIQSLRPGLGWQKGLSRGWRNFWQRELNERKEWELPPYMPLIKIEALPEIAEKIAADLEHRAAEYWISEEKKSEIWVRTKKFTMLTEILRPFFEIKSARKGFPAVSLYLD